MKITLSVLLCFSGSLIAQKPNFFIEGKVSLVSKSQYIFISDRKTKIKPDGSFSISGLIKKPEVIDIFTDSSTKESLWIMPGKYTLELKEITLNGIAAYLFRIPYLKGPADAKSFNGFSQARYSLGHNISDIQEKKKIRKAFAINYIDSLIRVNPNIGFLPYVISYSKPTIGNEKTAEYLDLLKDNKQLNSELSGIKNYFKRKELMRREKKFIDFTMKDSSRNIFTLSNLKAKLVLIDFWSSDCYQCRVNHRTVYKDLYQKYHSKGLEIVSISLDDNRKDWVKAIRQDSMPWINVSELKGWNNTVGNHYYIRGLPNYFWLDSDRNIFIDGLDEKQIEAVLNRE